MTKVKQIDKIVIDLSGPDGNVFNIISIANKEAVKEGYHPNERSKMTTEMMSGDYENALKVFVKNFGHKYELDDSNLITKYDI